MTEPVAIALTPPNGADYQCKSESGIYQVPQDVGSLPADWMVSPTIAMDLF
jgi:hypothetical protein